MTQPGARKTERFLILLTAVALALSVASPAFSKGKPPPEPEPPGGSCVDLGLSNDFDLDQDGLPDLIDCQGPNPQNGATIEYPGCLGAPPETQASQDCTDHTRADLFVEVVKDVPSAYESLGISDHDIFLFAENSLPLEVHVLPVGILPADRVILTYTATICQGGETPDAACDDDSQCGGGTCESETRTQAGARVFEDAQQPSDCPQTPLQTGVATHGNPNEFGADIVVFTGAIINKLNCEGEPEKSVQHVLNTSSHELAHGALRQATDEVGGFHLELTQACVMEPSIELGKGMAGFVIPTEFCANAQATVASGSTNEGPTLCGDATTIDDDGVFGCLPTPPAP